MAGIPALMRVRAAPYRVVVQLPASALRIGVAALDREFRRGGRLQDLLLRYTHALLTQIAQSVSCGRFHTTEERLGRWLLTSRDRANSDSFGLTQEFLAQMIGVPRTSMTAVAGTLRPLANKGERPHEKIPTPSDSDHAVGPHTYAPADAGTAPDLTCSG